MRRAYQLTIVLVVSVVCTDCADDRVVTSSPVNSSYSESVDFLQSWTRSYEEETDGDNAIQLYRPSDSRQFPSSWFRNRYVFGRDGNCEWLVFHPSDAHYMEPATWKADFWDRNSISIYNPVGTEVVRFRILDLASDLMRIESLKYAVPRCNYFYGKVDVYFRSEASFDDIDTFVRSLGREYTYLSMGQVLVRVEVISGNLKELKNQLEADEIVQSVTYVVQSYPYERDIFVISFVVGISTVEAAEVLEAYSELKLISTRKDRATVRIDVPVGHEDEWVARFAQEPLVENSRKAGSFCP